ncbi:MAG: hypothetical protein CL526_07280 [Aequorivita sp.]|nr:hypothetical protein [Aequorivita sp.]|tara:strand:+ start:51866 stop:53083 length:1218 start_codon:yes stop_codon:yes gene_type:complete
MNPSASDWILKFLDLFNKSDLIAPYKDKYAFYKALKETGFIYGASASALPKKALSNLKLTKQELTKINLFHALLYHFFEKFENASNEKAIESITAFYTHLEKKKTSFLNKFSISPQPANILEDILSTRLQDSNTVLKKNTVSLLTHSLLFLDVLAYSYWLSHPNATKTYYKNLENAALTACFYTLKSKHNKTKYDALLISLFETSSHYIVDGTESGAATFLESLNYLDKVDESLEKYFLLDLCCLTVWEDLQIDRFEHQFLQQLLVTLNFSDEELQKSLLALQNFSENYTEKILIFEYSHPVRQFYKQSAATVKLLIIRNKDRLARELEESGELVLLLGQSTLRDLSTQEKAKVKEQLLDICKTIPSLTIFLLPGGTVLLPLLVKFIPKLLPSAFQDNRIDSKKN